MVNYAYNKSKKIIQADDIDNGIIYDKEFNCVDCGLSLSYVKQSDKKGYICKSHFRHKDSVLDSECKKNSGKEEENKTIWNNKVSNFYINWYDIFDKKNKFITIKKNDKHYIANIYIESSQGINILSDNKTNILSNYIPKKLVIQLQHSKILKDKLHPF